MKCGVNPDRNRAACFAFAPDLPPFEETDDERMMRAFCEVARNGEGCHRYADIHGRASGCCRPRPPLPRTAPVNGVTPPRVS